MHNLQHSYGEALFKIAHEQNVDLSLKDELDSLLSTFQNKKDLNEFIQTLNNQLFSSFDDIYEGFASRFDEQYGTKTVYVSSAYALAVDEMQKLKNKLKALLKKEINLLCGVDKSLIGGIVIRFDDNEIDGSVRTKLIQMRKSLYNNGV